MSRIPRIPLSLLERGCACVSGSDDEGKNNRRNQERNVSRDEGCDAMASLCALFPALRKAPGAAPWDATAMLRHACGAISHGEQLAARFVLSVWNCKADWNEEAHKKGFLRADDRLRRFDVFEALAVWDFANREAFLTWARDPFFP